MYKAGGNSVFCVRGEDTQVRSRGPRQCRPKAIHEPFKTLTDEAFFTYM